MSRGSARAGILKIKNKVKKIMSMAFFFYFAEAAAVSLSARSSFYFVRAFARFFLVFAGELFFSFCLFCFVFSGRAQAAAAPIAESHYSW